MSSVSDIPSLLEEPGTTVAVVGATDSPYKYGSVIYRDLKAKGFEVFPVNPNRATVDGDPAFASLADLPVTPTVVNIVVPPQETLAVLESCVALGLDNIWLQPGAENEEALAYLEEHGLNYLARACIMVQARFAVR